MGESRVSTESSETESVTTSVDSAGLFVVAVCKSCMEGAWREKESDFHTVLLENNSIRI